MCQGSRYLLSFISKLPATLLLTAVSIVMTIIISVPPGVLAAVKQNRMTELRDPSDFSFIGNSLPIFFVSLILMYVRAIQAEMVSCNSKGCSV